MAKRRRAVRRARQAERQTNWLVVGAVVVVTVVALGALLALALQEPEIQPLAEFCQENPENCVSKGSTEAPVTIVEVSDYGCGHCRDFNLETAGLLEDLYVTPGQVRWIILPFALRAQTTPAAEASLCARDQERFYEYHRRLFEMQTEPQALATEGLMQAASDVGLNTDSFENCLDSGKYGNAVQRNIRAANQVGLRATPTFYINGQELRGNNPLTVFQQRINLLVSS